MKFAEECDIYDEAYFIQNNVYKWFQQEFATTNLSQKRLSMECKHIISSVKKNYVCSAQKRRPYRYYPEICSIHY